jgi:serine/threonine protein kinase
LLQLPNLCWIGLASNPFLQSYVDAKVKEGAHHLPVWDDPELSREDWPVLGQGAGGVTRQVVWKGQPVAVKTFSGALTSDGLPQDERAISVAVASLDHPGPGTTSTSSSSSCLISMVGQTPGGALIMELLQGYTALAGPPSFETCSRDVYPRQQFLSWDDVWTIVTGLLQVLVQLHTLGICHGDFYGHNILISSSEDESSSTKSSNDSTTSSFRVKLSDFGAAFFYDPTSESAKDIERVEVRAFGVLVEELLEQVWNRLGTDTDGKTIHEKRVTLMLDLVQACRTPTATFAGVWETVQLHVTST